MKRQNMNIPQMLTARSTLELPLVMDPLARATEAAAWGEIQIQTQPDFTFISL